jgi:ParB-like chromosome segregation protein Spo0J
MAKRRRLSPAKAEYLGATSGPDVSEKPDTTGTAGITPRPAAPIANVAGDAAATAALVEVTDRIEEARRDGRLVLELAVEKIDAGYLVRDRIPPGDGEMTALKQSLRQRGQQTPIEVIDLGQGQYGLISGWRRLTALKELAAENRAPETATETATEPTTILALLRRPATAPDAYLAMVEENEIRTGLSFYERARIVVKSVDQGVFETEKTALQTLFGSVSRSRRSKIKSFVTLVHRLDGVLRFPSAISERSGLALAKALNTDPALARDISGRLDRAAVKTAEDETAILVLAIVPETPVPSVVVPPKPAGPGEQIANGIYLETGRDGRLVLRGKAVDDSFRARLVDWLLAQE